MNNTKYWGESNPVRSDGESHRYLVYHFGLNAFTEGHFQRVTVAGGRHIDNLMDVCEFPELLAECELVRLSLVDERHPMTMSDGGVIVRVPIENVVSTSPKYVDAPEHGDVMPPSHLLTLTGENGVNSVFVRGRTTAGKIELVGYFTKGTDEHGPVNAAMTGYLYASARRRGLPMRQIIEPSAYARDGAYLVTNELQVQFGSSLYQFPIFDLKALDPARELPRFTVDNDATKRWMDPTEAREALVFARAHLARTSGIELDIDAHMTRFNEADRRRQLPDIVWDSNGELVEISRTGGYDLTEYYAQLSAPAEGGGRANVLVNLHNKRSEERFSMMRGTPVKSMRFTQPLSDLHARGMIEVASRFVPPERRDAFRRFVERVEQDLADRRRTIETRKGRKWWDALPEYKARGRRPAADAPEADAPVEPPSPTQGPNEPSQPTTTTVKPRPPSAPRRGGRASQGAEALRLPARRL